MARCYELYRNNEFPPLFVTVMAGLYHCTKFLLDKCDVNVNEVCFGATALTMAITNNHENVINLLINHRDIILQRQPHQESTYLQIAMMYNFKIFRQLLDNEHIDVNEPNAYGGTVFHVACRQDYVDALRFLLSPRYKPRVNMIAERLSASHQACYNGNFAIMKLLEDNDCFQPFADNARHTPFVLACCRNNVSIIRYILTDENGYFKWKSHVTQLFNGLGFACKFGHIAMIEILFKHMNVSLLLLFSHLWGTIKRSKLKASIVIINNIFERFQEPTRNMKECLGKMMCLAFIRSFLEGCFLSHTRNYLGSCFACGSMHYVGVYIYVILSF